MDSWRAQLSFDPLPVLLATDDEALHYWVQHDLLGEERGPVSRLWALPGAQHILRKQAPDGGWPPTGKAQYPAVSYVLIETWRQIRFLVGQYGWMHEDVRAQRAAEFLFSCQTDEGDWRGFLADQYAPYYTGALLGLLIQMGYGGDPRIERGLRWLLAMRQDDGGWTIPILTHRLDRAAFYRFTSTHATPLELDRSQPYSHNWTGMALRAFAAHPVHRHDAAVVAAARLLASRFFQADSYTSYRSADYWTRFDYPFWWNHLVAALDVVTLIGLRADVPEIEHARQWLADHQSPDGLWPLSQIPGEPRGQAAATRHTRQWVALAICRVLARLETPADEL